MTKGELVYIKRLVQDVNKQIVGVANGTLWDSVYKTNAERLAVVQSMSCTVEPFALLVGLEVVAVDVRHLMP